MLARAAGRVDLVGLPGTLIGVRPDLVLKEAALEVTAGDSLIFYTDGVTERRSGAEMLGERGLIAAISAGIGRDADGLAGALEQAVNDFSPEIARDDLAIVVVQRPASPVTSSPLRAQTVRLLS